MTTTRMATSNDTGTRRYLGVGWAFPVRPSAGRLGWARYEEDVEQAIGIILETARRERLMLPGFGAGLPDHVFGVQSPATHRAVENVVKRALVDWEPRITVERVAARASESTPSLLLIEIDYVIRRSNAFYNGVFPFYLNRRA